MIKVENLSKDYLLKKKEPGLSGALKGLIKNEYSGGAGESGVDIYALTTNSTELVPQLSYKYDSYENEIKNGQMIIAAYNNNGLPTMPAGHEAVIGVRTDPTLKGAEYVVDNTSSKKDYIASSQHELRSLWGKILFTSVSTSFAVPTVTAALIDKTRDSQRLE